MEINFRFKLGIGLFLIFFLSNFFLFADDEEKVLSEQRYKSFLSISESDEGAQYFNELNNMADKLKWDEAEPLSVVGNLRIIKNEFTEYTDLDNVLYFVRSIEGELFILSIPKSENIEKDSGSYYANLLKMLEDKMSYDLVVLEAVVNGETAVFARYTAPPIGLVFDKIFKISMVLMLFLVMTGMGMTLTINDFSLIAKNPRGIIVGLFCQFIILPLIAFGLGHLLGYPINFPFIFIGMILITATPGGATSNLMTYFAKGDLALSISMTALATILSLFITPLILVILCSNIPDISMPIETLVGTIFVLVLLPLIVGMLIRKKWQLFADKATPFFSLLGIVSVLFIGAGGVFSNLEVFSDIFEDLGFEGFLVFFSLTALGMIVGGLVPKLMAIKNYQTRAISMEIGIRNVALGMTIALLIQDEMGDFNSHMFAVSGIFAIFMYVAGIIAIFTYKKLLPDEVKVIT